MLLREMLRRNKDSKYMQTTDGDSDDISEQHIQDDSSEWYSDVCKDPNMGALIDLFSSGKAIKDHRDLHGLADTLGVESSELEEMAYVMLTSFFSRGKYMKDGQGKDFDKNEIAMGDKVELEHTDNSVIARRISLDHLTEIQDYYIRLKKMEEDATKSKQESKDSYTKNKDVSEPETVFVVSLSGDEGEILRMLEYIKKTSEIGHSFPVVVDPGDDDYEKKFGFDGDGAFRIINIEEQKK